METSGMLDAQLIVRATAAAGLAKTGVDVLRTQRDLYSWVPPVAAFLLSFVILVCLSEATGIPINSRQAFASAVLGAFVAAPMAIGATAVQAAVERRVSDQKVSDVQDAAQAQHERIVSDVVPRVAEVMAERISSANVDQMAEAARRGAQEAIRLAKTTPAA